MVSSTISNLLVVMRPKYVGPGETFGCAPAGSCFSGTRASRIGLVPPQKSEDAEMLVLL
jgi:hypothetical protein